MAIEFNPREHLINIKNRSTGSSEYLPVQWRLVWFRGACPEGTIETELVHLDLDKETEEETFVWNPDKRRSEPVLKTGRGIAIFKATVKDGKGGIATGIGSEKAASFGDYIEKAETKAIGRALAGLGYGTQFAPELDESHRIVDSPVEERSVPRESAPRPANSPMRNGQPAAKSQPISIKDGHPVFDSNPGTVTDQQRESMKKLEEALGRTPLEHPEKLSQLAAAKTIEQMTKEYRELQRQQRATPQQVG